MPHALHLYLTTPIKSDGKFMYYIMQFSRCYLDEMTKYALVCCSWCKELDPVPESDLVVG